jgi:hypothetical protein
VRHLDPDDHGAPWPRRSLSGLWRGIARGWISRAVAGAIIVSLGLATQNVALAAAKKTSKIPSKLPPAPDSKHAASMVKVTLVTLNNAVLTKNFGVLWSQSASTLRRRYSKARLRRAFASFIKRGVDLAPALNLAPKWSASPQVDAHGELRLVGWFHTRPRIVRFDLRYLRERGRWRLSMIDVDTTRPANK